MPNGINHEKSFAVVISELKMDASEFIQTRLQMLTAEMKTKFDVIKTSAPALLAAALLAGVAFLCLTVALVAVIAMAFGGGVGAWALSFFIVGFCYMIFAAMAGYFGYQQISSEGLAPKRTMKILKQDQAWIANEARTQL